MLMVKDNEIIYVFEVYVEQYISMGYELFA